MQNKDKGDRIEDSSLDMLLVILLEGASKEVIMPSSVALVGNDLDPRMGCDSRIEPVGSIRSFELALDRNLRVRSKLKPEERAIIETTLKDNTDLFV